MPSPNNYAYKDAHGQGSEAATQSNAMQEVNSQTYCIFNYLNSGHLLQIFGLIESMPIGVDSKVSTNQLESMA